MNVLQERPAPRYSGIVKHARDKGQKIKLSSMFKDIFNYIFKVLTMQTNNKLFLLS